MVAPDGLRLSFNFGKPMSAFAFHFSDGTLSARVSCGDNQYICSFWTHKNEFPASVYKLLQQKNVVLIDAGANTYKVSPENSSMLNRMFSCLTP